MSSEREDGEGYKENTASDTEVSGSNRTHSGMPLSAMSPE